MEKFQDKASHKMVLRSLLNFIKQSILDSILQVLLGFFCIFFFFFFFFFCFFNVCLTISSTLEQKANGTLDFRSEQLLRCLSRGDLLNSFHSLGDQISYLWNTFLKFHRLDLLNIITIV
jgi:hypothetical protein